MKSKIMVVICVMGLILIGTPRSFASNGEPTANPGSVVVDALLVRPACFVATIVGGALFIISLPVAVPSKSVHRVAKSLVVKPADATFKRPLGDFTDLSAD
jgi:hypothetical protein